VQDPSYTKVDQAVLSKHGITILGDPKGILEVDDSTAVLSCSPDIPVKQIVSDLANPAIMMVDRVLDHDPSGLVRYIYDFYQDLLLANSSKGQIPTLLGLGT
jgi:hypothetical protein